MQHFDSDPVAPPPKIAVRSKNLVKTQCAIRQSLLESCLKPVYNITLTLASHCRMEVNMAASSSVEEVLKHTKSQKLRCLTATEELSQYTREVCTYCNSNLPQSKILGM